MDLLLLKLTGKIQGCTATHQRLFLAALYGASMASILTVLPVIPGFVKLAAGYGIVSISMVKLCFKEMEGKHVLKGTVCLYGMAVCMGGVLQLLTIHIPYFRKSGMNLIQLGVFGYLIFLLFLLIRYGAKYLKKNNLYPVKLVFQERELELVAFMDTGNSLMDPSSRKPVCLVEPGTMQKLFGETKPAFYHAIPFHSVGRKHGILKGYVLTRMYISGKNKRTVIENPIIAVVEEGLSMADNRYQMILNPIYIEGEET